MHEKKTRLALLRNQELKTFKTENDKINKLCAHISTNDITQLNKLIYEEAKLLPY